MPCFLCKNINRGNSHTYAGVEYYFCTVHEEQRAFNYHCDRYDPEAISTVVANIFQNYDFFAEKIHYIKDVASGKGYVIDLGHLKGDPMRYISCESDDIIQGLKRNRNELEMMIDILRQIIRSQGPIKWIDQA